MTCGTLIPGTHLTVYAACLPPEGIQGVVDHEGDVELDKPCDLHHFGFVMLTHSNGWWHSGLDVTVRVEPRS